MKAPTLQGAPATDAPLPLRKSLRARGVLATLALLAYFALAGTYVALERTQLDRSVQELEAVSRHEKAVALAEAAVGTALVEVKDASSVDQTSPPSPANLQSSLESSAMRFGALEAFDPGYTRLQRAIARSVEELNAQPMRANWIDLREALARAASELEIRRASLAEQRDVLMAAYRRAYDAVTVQTLLLGVVGLIAFGTLAGWFFAQLAHDIGRLELHARAIVGGRRGVALPVQREDELGRLMHAVNRMAVDLDEREQRLALESQQRSHHDKMLAVSALAAGMAHEVNNPLAVIVGAAQTLRDDAAALSRADVAMQAGHIVDQAQRAAQAARQLAEAAAPQPADADWFDLAALVRQALRWLAYDKRWRGCAFDLVDDAALGAVHGSADSVQQVLMQLLPLAAEAAAKGPQEAPRVSIELGRADPDTVQVRLLFQGQPDYSREDVQRRLLLARALLTPLGAGLALGQADPARTHVTLLLPAKRSDDSNA